MITLSSPVAFKDLQIDMAHGAGGKASRRLVEGLIAPLVGACEPLTDAAYLTVGDVRIAVTTEIHLWARMSICGGSVRPVAESITW